MSVNRRQFVSGVAGVTTGVALAGSAPAIAKNRIEFDIASTIDRDTKSTYTNRDIPRLLDWIERATDGNVVFSLFDGDIPEDGEFRIASEGEADGYFAGEYHWIDYSMLYRLFGGMMPMGLTLPEYLGWFYDRGGEKMWHELGAKFNIRGYMGRTRGYQNAGWFAEEVVTEQVFQDRILDFPGAMGYIFDHFGAKSIDYIEEQPIAEKLRSGDMLAAERSNPYYDMKMDYHLGARYFYPEIIHEPHTFATFALNLDGWAKLPAGMEERIRMACIAHQNLCFAESTARNAAALRELQDVHGLKIMKFPPELMQQIVDLSAQYVQETYARVDDFTTKVVNSYIDYWHEVRPWSEVTVELFHRNRRLTDKFTRV